MIHGEGDSSSASFRVSYPIPKDATGISLVPQAELRIDQTVELNERLHVDMGPDGRPVGIEILYPSIGPIDLGELSSKYRLNVRIPFTFAA